MLERVQQNCNALPAAITADAGYWAPENASWCEEHAIDAYIATQRQRHGTPNPATPSATLATPSATPATPSATPATPSATPTPDGEASATDIEKMRNKVASPAGRKIYARRKVLPEPVFGQIKEARGFRRFSLRGLSGVQGEWAFVCACHNLLKLYRVAKVGKEMNKAA